MRRFLLMVPLAALLSACQVVVDDPGPTPPPTWDYTFTAQPGTFPPSSRGQVSLPAGQDVVVRIQTGAISTDPTRLMVFEIEAPAGTRLDVYDGAGQRVGSSRRPTFFAATPTAAATAVDAFDARRVAATDRARGVARDRTALERESISVAWTCVGPCVAFRPTPTTTGATYYMVVRSTSSRTAAVYAYLTQQADQNEPNDTQATATVIAGSPVLADVQGAIERLGDQDYYRIAQTGWGGTSWVEVDMTAVNAPPQLQIYAVFLRDGFELHPGDDPVVAEVGEVFVVRARVAGTDTPAGGPAGTSRYTIFVEPSW